jgi:hypothetical protein
MYALNGCTKKNKGSGHYNYADDDENNNNQKIILLLFLIHFDLGRETKKILISIIYYYNT